MWVNSKTAEEVDALLRPQWRPWFEALAPDVRDALRTYKSGKHGHFAIARDGVAARDITQEDEDRWQALDRAFGEARWHADTMVWRGFRQWSSDGEPPDWKLPSVGDRERFELWTSTSLRETVAAQEAGVRQARAGDFSVLYEIELPKGFPAIYMEAVKDSPTHEAEILLPRGTPYEVVAVQQFSRLRTVPAAEHPSFGPEGCWRIHLRLLPYGSELKPLSLAYPIPVEAPDARSDNASLPIRASACSQEDAEKTRQGFASVQVGARDRMVERLAT